MVRVSQLASLLSVAASFSLCSAGKVPFGSLAAASSSSSSSSSSDHAVSVTRAQGSTGFNYSHARNSEYTATIYVNGVPFQVILDTGSSDTWIDPLSQGVFEPTGLFHTGYNSSTTYVDGSTSSGPIVLADVSFGAYTIKNQAISIAYNASPDATLYNGLIGLGGALGSQIYSTLKNTSWEDNAAPVLYNLFKHEPDLPNYTTFLMDRTEIGISDGGVLTVSEVLSNMTEVLDAPLITSPVAGQWTTVVDGVYVNGELLTGHSNFTKIYEQHFNMTIADGATIATFDTGTATMLAPPEYVKAIYGRVPGAALNQQFSSSDRVVYDVPCNTKLNISFSIGGQLYPMHPADAIDVNMNPDGTFSCIGVILGGASSTEDFLLGDSFLRNFYQLYDYGGTDALLSKPSVRLLPLADQAQAWAEADAINLARILAYENDYQSAISATQSATATARPFWTGSDSPAALTSAQDGSIPASVASATASPSATATSSSAQGADAQGDVRLAGALSEDGNDASKSVDLSTLTRNSYIILGLLAAVLVTLVAVVALVTKASRANKGYRAVPVTTYGGGLKAPLGADEEVYSTPYDSRA
ncbi:aspartic peptidase domain-containing protein [Cubamyces lactineus]|nr:aspartic peptidase domain-containing protein [Cubamyces lactineus]